MSLAEVYAKVISAQACLNNMDLRKELNKELRSEASYQMSIVRGAIEARLKAEELEEDEA